MVDDNKLAGEKLVGETSVPVRTEPPPILGVDAGFVPERMMAEPDVTPCAFAAIARRQEMGIIRRSSITGLFKAVTISGAAVGRMRDCHSVEAHAIKVIESAEASR